MEEDTTIKNGIILIGGEGYIDYGPNILLKILLSQRTQLPIQCFTEQQKEKVLEVARRHVIFIPEPIIIDLEKEFKLEQKQGNDEFKIFCKRHSFKEVNKKNIFSL